MLPYTLTPIFMKSTEIAAFILREKKPVAYNLLWVDEAVDHSTGDFQMPRQEDLKTGAGHVILLVGFNPKTRKFIFRNCWGSGWGNKGYGTLLEEYVIKYSEMVLFQPLSQYPAEVRQFLEKASLGVSANLSQDRLLF